MTGAVQEAGILKKAIKRFASEAEIAGILAGCTVVGTGQTTQRLGEIEAFRAGCALEGSVGTFQAVRVAELTRGCVVLRIDEKVTLNTARAVIGTFHYLKISKKCENTI